MADSTTRIAGCDLGKSSAKFVIGNRGPDGAFTVERMETVVHDGRPGAAFRDWYRKASIFSCRALGVTGVHAEEVGGQGVMRLPEDACLEAALPGWTGSGAAANVISVGARGYSVLGRRADGRVEYLERGKCSSGTGETVVKSAARFGRGIEGAGRIARRAASIKGGAGPSTADSESGERTGAMRSERCRGVGRNSSLEATTTVQSTASRGANRAAAVPSMPVHSASSLKRRTAAAWSSVAVPAGTRTANASISAATCSPRARAVSNEPSTKQICGDRHPC